MIAEKQPAIWRGAIVGKALDQLLYDTQWGELDFLIIDMPPGTGDIHLTMCQKMPITAVIAITTPQDIALIDVIKSIEMYKKLDIPCLGIIENMSIHICANCGFAEAIFGEMGAEKIAKDYNLEILVKIPLDISIRQSSDEGNPVRSKETQIAKIYKELSLRVLHQVSLLAKDYSSKIGKINVL